MTTQAWAAPCSLKLLLLDLGGLSYGAIPLVRSALGASLESKAFGACMTGEPACMQGVYRLCKGLLKQHLIWLSLPWHCQIRLNPADSLLEESH